MFQGSHFLLPTQLEHSLTSPKSSTWDQLKSSEFPLKEDNYLSNICLGSVFFQEINCPQSLTLPLKIVAGRRILSYWEVNFSGANSLLNFERVNSRSQSHQFHPTLTHWHANYLVQQILHGSAQRIFHGSARTISSAKYCEVMGAQKKCGFQVGKFFHL